MKYTERTYPNGTVKLGFSRRGCGTSTNFKQITKEEYDRYSAMSNGELSALIESGLDDSVRWGYGYYGCESYHDAEQDLYFLGICTGNSCD